MTAKVSERREVESVDSFPLKGIYMGDVNCPQKISFRKMCRHVVSECQHIAHSAFGEMTNVSTHI